VRESGVTGGLRYRMPGPGKRADELLAEFLAGAGDRASRVEVVTDDRALATRVTDLGGRATRVESFLAELIRGRIPAPLLEAIRGLAQTARTFQELREGLLALPMPTEVALYLQRTIDKAPPSTVPSPEIAVYMLTKEIAQSIMWAFLFIIIWMILAILIKGFMSMIFIGGDGKTIIGVFDGVLGTVVMTFILLAFLVVFSGVIFPVVLISKPDGGFARFYTYLLDSGLIRWFARIYQLYIVPWIG